MLPNKLTVWNQSLKQSWSLQGKLSFAIRETNNAILYAKHGLKWTGLVLCLIEAMIIHVYQDTMKIPRFGKKKEFLLPLWFRGMQEGELRDARPRNWGNMFKRIQRQDEWIDTKYFHLFFLFVRKMSYYLVYCVHSILASLLSHKLLIPL